MTDKKTSPHAFARETAAIDVRLQLRENQENLGYIINKLAEAQNDPDKIENFKKKGPSYINLCKTALQRTEELIRYKLTLTA